MRYQKAIVHSEDIEIIHLCQQLGNELGLKVTSKSDLATFLLALFENDYLVALFDCQHVNDTSLNWVRVVRKTRPKIPLIIFSEQVDHSTGGKIYDEGTFYLCVRPVRIEEIRNALYAAISSYPSNFKIQ